MKTILLLIVSFALVLAVSARRRNRHGTKTKGGHHHLPKKPDTCTIPNCKNCSSSWLPSCDVCDRGLVRVKVVLGYACWKKCPPRYRNVKGTCKRGADCTPNCQKCQNSLACTVCADEYALHRAFSGLRARCIRQCPNGYKKEVNPMGGYKCVRQCTPNCEKCKNGYSCSVCERGYALFKRLGLRARGRCIRRCPRGYKTQETPKGDKKCVKQCQVMNCAFCSPLRNKCFKCKPGLYKLSTGRSSDFCFSHCPSGYVPKTVNGVNVCKRYEPSAEPKGKPTAEPTPSLTTSRESISTTSESWTTRETTTITTEPESRPDTFCPTESITTEPTTEPEPTTIEEDFWP